jgi:hypothetical protein
MALAKFENGRHDGAGLGLQVVEHLKHGFDCQKERVRRKYFCHQVVNKGHTNLYENCAASDQR